MAKQRTAVLCLALLSGCAGAGGWVKNGVDPSATAREYQDCAALADAAVETTSQIDQDIIASRRTDWQRADVVREQTGMMSDATADRSRAIVDSCMRGKGFAAGS